MGEEADADWDAGLVEWGRESSRWRANVKIRHRGHRVQVVEYTTRKVLFSAYYEADADEWCAKHGHYIIERP